MGCPSSCDEIHHTAFRNRGCRFPAWNGTMNPAGNSGMPTKFSVPAVVNGKVYLATFSN